MLVGKDVEVREVEAEATQIEGAQVAQAGRRMHVMIGGYL